MAGERGTTHGIGSVRAGLARGAFAALGAAAFGAGPVQASPETVAIKLAAPGAWAYVDDTGKVRPSGSFTGVPPDSSLTPEGLRQRQSFDFKTDDPVLGCGEPGMPRALTAASPMTFAWQDDSLVIKYESMDVTRRVHMHQLMVPENAPRSPNGYSRGFWDGDTLVVETMRLDNRVQDLQGTPKSDSMRLVERYRVDEQDDETYLRVDLTMIDDKVFAKPYEWHLDYVDKPDWSLLEYACEERPQELTPGVVPDEAELPG